MGAKGLAVGGGHRAGFIKSIPGCNSCRHWDYRRLSARVKGFFREATPPPAGSAVNWVQLETVVDYANGSRRHRRLESRLNPQAGKPAPRRAEILVGGFRGLS
jgi:hypothetical protein